MDTVSLSLQARSTDEPAKVIRRKGLVPCVVYGNKVEHLSLQGEHKDIYKAYAKAGESTLVELNTGKETVPVLFHSLDFDSVSDRIIHVDFFAVDMKKEIETEVPIHFIGEAPAIKDLGGVLVTSIDKLTVKCLPAKLPHALEVDISSIANFGDNVTVAQVKVPAGVEILAQPEDVLASAQEPRKEEEVVPTPAEGEVPAEGAAAEGAEGAEGASDGDKGKANDED